MNLKNYNKVNVNKMISREETIHLINLHNLNCTLSTVSINYINAFKDRMFNIEARINLEKKEAEFHDNNYTIALSYYQTHHAIHTTTSNFLTIATVPDQNQVLANTNGKPIMVMSETKEFLKEISDSINTTSYHMDVLAINDMNNMVAEINKLVGVEIPVQIIGEGNHWLRKGDQFLKYLSEGRIVEHYVNTQIKSLYENGERRF